MTPPQDRDLSALKARVECADYTVEPGLVAEAIIRRMTAARARRGPGITLTRAEYAAQPQVGTAASA